MLGKLQKARERLAEAKVRSTIPFVENAVEQGEKVLLFSCFAIPLERIREHFGDAAVGVSGEMPRKIALSSTRAWYLFSLRSRWLLFCQVLFQSFMYSSLRAPPTASNSMSG